MQKYDKEATDTIIKESLANDIPKRNIQLNNFIRLLNSINTNQIISIDGDWGCGKTFFVKQLLYLHGSSLDGAVNLDKTNTDLFGDTYLPIYYNAWKNDYHCDPLESLTMSVVRGYAEMKSYLRQDLGKVGQVLSSALKVVVNTAVERATCGLVKDVDFSALSEGEFEKFISNVKKQDNKKHAIESLFGDILQTNKRILLVIDDLDRCKPGFAVQMLEIIKHLYDNERITILVVTNNRQLAKNVEHYYGQGTNGYKYLNRIYDTVITFDTENIEDYLAKECNIQVSERGVAQWIATLCKYFGFSYRDCNKLATMYEILVEYLETDSVCRSRYDLFCAAMHSLALVLKIYDGDEYRLFIRGTGTKILDTVIDYLTTSGKDSHNVLEWLQYITASHVDNTSNPQHPAPRQNILAAYRELFDETNDIKGHVSAFKDAISMLGNSISLD